MTTNTLLHNSRQLSGQACVTYGFHNYAHVIDCASFVCSQHRVWYIQDVSLDPDKSTAVPWAACAHACHNNNNPLSTNVMLMARTWLPSPGCELQCCTSNVQAEIWSRAAALVRACDFIARQVRQQSMLTSAEQTCCLLQCVQQALMLLLPPLLLALLIPVPATLGPSSHQLMAEFLH